MPTIEIRNLIASDRSAWEILWSKYLEFYETSLPTSMFNLAFERLISPNENEYTGLIALLSGEAVGIAHTLKHRHGWKSDLPSGSVCKRKRSWAWSCKRVDS
ncbi:MAG: hypothetical protein L3J21_00990 [Devosiaceae bacterium]|nr:hypothetical protein [Devosiaceae bacterium]